MSNAAAHRPTPLPDRIVLTWQTDPATSQAVTWRTDTTVTTAAAEFAVAEDSAAFAGYGKAKGQARTTQVRAVTTPLKTDLNEAHCHSVNFTGLAPDTKYLYRVGDGVNWSEWLEFKTAVAGAAPFTFLYFGDAQNDIKSHWSRVIRRAFADAPDARFLLHAGDLINTANSDAEWGEWFAAGGWLNGMVPSVPTPGNHEWFDSAAPPPQKLSKEEKETAKEEPKRDPALYRGAISRHWRPQFALPENGPPGQEELTYYFDFQGVRIVSLNSNEGRNKSYADKAAQAGWLEGVLADNPNRWPVVTFHHPVFSPAKDRDNPDLRRLWQPIFDKHKVDLVLQGHDYYLRPQWAGRGGERPRRGARTGQWGNGVRCVRERAKDVRTRPAGLDGQLGRGDTTLPGDPDRRRHAAVRGPDGDGRVARRVRTPKAVGRDERTDRASPTRRRGPRLVGPERAVPRPPDRPPGGHGRGTLLAATRTVKPVEHIFKLA